MGSRATTSCPTCWRPHPVSRLAWSPCCKGGQSPTATSAPRAASMKKQKAATGQFVNLTSLVDVVSMNVGILVILAVFMALLAVFSSSQDPAAGGAGKEGSAGASGPGSGAGSDARVTEPPVVRINVPWSHPTPKQTLFFIVRDK